MFQNDDIKPTTTYEKGMCSGGKCPYYSLTNIGNDPFCSKSYLYIMIGKACVPWYSEEVVRLRKEVAAWKAEAAKQVRKNME